MTNKPELKPCPLCSARLFLDKDDCPQYYFECDNRHSFNIYDEEGLDSAVAAMNTRAEPAAPSSDEVNAGILFLSNMADCMEEEGLDRTCDYENINAVLKHIEAQAAKIERLRKALAPFSDAAAKYRDIGKSPVADYIKQKTGLIAGYNTVFVKLCADRTSPKNWFDAADALAQADGKVGE